MNSKPLTKLFTLTEMLIVIAIFMVLLSLLSPALRKSLDISRGIVCGNKLSTYSKLNLLYSEENNGYLIPQYQGGIYSSSGTLLWNAGYWPLILSRQETNNDGLFNADRDKFCGCPSRTTAVLSDQTPSWGYNIGVAPHASPALHLSKIGSPSGTFMFVENINNPSTDYGYYLISNSLGWFGNINPHSPHAKCGVQAYVDGHLSKLHEAEMAQYRINMSKLPFTP